MVLCSLLKTNHDKKIILTLLLLDFEFHIFTIKRLDIVIPTIVQAK